MASSDGMASGLARSWVVRFPSLARMDLRLADKLIKLADGADSVATTHQKLSVELGTAREVISRQLQAFQRRGWTPQGRGAVELVDKKQLEGLAGQMC